MISIPVIFSLRATHGAHTVNFAPWPWGRPVLFVKKRDTDVDHRPSKANKYPALRVADLFQIGRAHV